MKKAENRATRKGFMLGQCRRGAPGIKRLRGRQHKAPAPSAALAERGRRGHALGAVLALALLLFAVLGLLAAITGASAFTPNQLSARSWAARPTKTPPPRRSPTPTTVPSPTAPAPPSPAPSPTFTAIPTTRATVPASAAPPGKATTPSATGKPGGSPRPTPVSTLSTSSPAVHHPSRVQQREGGAFVPLVLGTLSGIAAVALLVAGGRWLLRQWLLPVRKVKGPPSGAAPWQRVRTTSPHGSMNSPGDRRQPFPTTDAFLPARETVYPPEEGVSSPTSSCGPKWQAMWPTRQFLRPTRLEAIRTRGTPAAGKSSRAILPRQNSQPMAPLRERARAKNGRKCLAGLRVHFRGTPL